MIVDNRMKVIKKAGREIKLNENNNKNKTASSSNDIEKRLRVINNKKKQMKIER